MSYTKVFSALDDVLVDRTSNSIAKAFGALVLAEVFGHGDKLPPIRTVAAHLGVSTTTVSDAWATMAAHGMIETDRRRGTRVVALPSSGRSRYWQVPAAPGTLPIDLSTGTPDPTLLPDVGPILARISTDLGVSSYVDPPVLDALDAALREFWPYEPRALTVLDGALDAFERTMRSLVRLGDTVLVEDPTYPPLLDALEAAGVNVVGIPLDEAGIEIEALRTAMAHGPRAIVIQTGVHNPTGHEVTTDRLLDIAAAIDGTRTLVIEDVQGWNRDRAFRSVGVSHPDQTVRIQSFSKTHGPDLRIAALAGPAALVDDIVDRRQLGPGWTSRLTQRVLAEMLLDADVEAVVNNGITVYAARRERLVDALEARGLEQPTSHGLNLWLPVRDEQRSTVALAALGIGVAPGRPFLVDSTDAFIRVTVSMLHDDVDIDMVADALVMAANA